MEQIGNDKEADYGLHPNMIDENASPEVKNIHDVMRDGEYDSTNAKSGVKNENEMPSVNNFRSNSQPFERASRSKLQTTKTELFKPREKPKNMKGLIENFLDSNIELWVMAIFTCFALFGSDLKVIFLYPKHDDIFNAIYLFVLFLFLVEFFCNWYVKPAYVSTFFFWLDLMSIVSMFLEIDWILNPLVDEFIM
jgi:hypothetical protein